MNAPLILSSRRHRTGWLVAGLLLSPMLLFADQIIGEQSHVKTSRQVTQTRVVTTPPRLIIEDEPFSALRTDGATEPAAVESVSIAPPQRQVITTYHEAKTVTKPAPVKTTEKSVTTHKTETHHLVAQHYTTRTHRHVVAATSRPKKHVIIQTKSRTHTWVEEPASAVITTTTTTTRIIRQPLLLPPVDVAETHRDPSVPHIERSRVLTVSADVGD